MTDSKAEPMSKGRRFKREQLLDYLLLGAGMGGAFEGLKILLVMLGWRERERTFEVDVTFCAALAAFLGAYVMIRATKRMSAREGDHKRKLADFHDKAERARAASKQS
jgi:hypothetical protein